MKTTDRMKSTTDRMKSCVSIPHEIDDHDWKEAFEFAPFRRDEVVEVIACEEGENDGDSWVGIFRLSNGRYGYLKAGCDYSGWDCQSNGVGDTRATLVEIVNELCEDDDRRRLKLTIASGFGHHVVLVNGVART